MKRWFREPLFHFLIGGSLLFVLLSWFAVDRGADAPRRIIVAQEALIAFVQWRTGIDDASAALRDFEALDPDARQEWVDRYVREEVLVREARALGLDRDDELIRRRLVQKVEFLTLGLLESELRVDEAELAAFYHDRGEEYREPAMLSFTHVFLRATPGAFERAKALLETLNENRVTFRGALGLGDRFPYNRNYVDRSIDEVRSHFGDAFAGILVRATPSDSVWTGPYESSQGWHLVLLTRRTQSRIPPLAQLAPLLRDDLLREKRDAALDRAVDELVSEYDVEFVPARSLRMPAD